MSQTDFLVVGAGIAGASAAYELAAHGSVLLLEREAHPGYHTTGRSAAVFSETYGNEVIRALSIASRAFFATPPAGFAEYPLWTPRPALFIGRPDQVRQLDDWYHGARRLVSGISRLDAQETAGLVPALRAGYVAGGVLETGAADLDVNELHRGFLRGAAQRGAQLLCDAEVRSIARNAGAWLVESRRGQHQARIVVNAAGAWGDELAATAGAAPVGLEPRRRTAIIFPVPEPLDVRGWPVVVDIDEQFYFKPEAGKLLGSPADETPSAPCDAQPDELDVAIAASRIESTLDFPLGRIERKWAGLRSFVADRTPVVGFDERIRDFFWLVGQGGYGIQTAPAMGRLAASLITSGAIPSDIASLGVQPQRLAPGRVQQAPGRLQR
jgi:D-arginine dehydrogenase